MNAFGKKVTVLGLGKTGYASALFLKKRGFHVFVSEVRESSAILERAWHLKRHGVEVETGGHCLDRIRTSDWILISPGISPSSPVCRELKKEDIPICSEIELASWYCPTAKVLAVTGTAGKTTVTTLLARILKRSGIPTVSCGNIGNPWVSEIDQLTPEHVVVLEVSSFQLTHCYHFRPHVAILLNLSSNHEDWHGDMGHYVQAKLKLFENQREEDLALFRHVDQRAFFPSYRFRAQVVYLDDGHDLQHGRDENEVVLYRVAALLGLKLDVVYKTLEEFEGIEDRLERIGEIAGVQFVNDSKCTTPRSLAWALEKYPDGRVVLIAGGHPKTRDFSSVRSLVAKKVKKAILIGEAADILKAAWEGVCSLETAEDFRKAVFAASGFARPQDVVLLSPACASFDMFANYEERGRAFKAFVREWAANHALKTLEGSASFSPPQG